MWTPQIKVEIDNISFLYTKDVYLDNGISEPESSLGDMVMEFPKGMMRTFLKECGKKWSSGEIWLPHEDPYQAKEYEKGSDHSCANPDTHIVFLNHFFNKQRKYHNIEYVGHDIFWLFHDSRHAHKDVQSQEVNNIDSRIEHERLIEGAELAKMHGHSMSGLTLYNLKEAWKDRWRYERGSIAFDFRYFYNMLSDLDKKYYEVVESMGNPAILNEFDINYYYDERFSENDN